MRKELRLKNVAHRLTGCCGIEPQMYKHRTDPSPEDSVNVGDVTIRGYQMPIIQA